MLWRVLERIFALVNDTIAQRSVLLDLVIVYLMGFDCEPTNVTNQVTINIIGSHETENTNNEINEEIFNQIIN